MSTPALPDEAGAASLDQARLNLYAQASGLQDFVTQLFSAAGANLTAQAKALDKVTRPILVRLGRAVGEQQGQLDQVVQPLLLGAQNAIAEQGIQLASAVSGAATASAVQPTPLLSVQPLQVPPSVRAPVLAAAPAGPTRPEATQSGLADSRLADTAATLNYTPEPAPSGIGVLSGATGDANPDGVTNIIALRPCDLKAIVDALSRPSYGPYIDAVRGMLKGEEGKMEAVMGPTIAEAFADDPDSTIEDVLMQVLQSTLSGSTGL